MIQLELMGETVIAPEHMDVYLAEHVKIRRPVMEVVRLNFDIYVQIVNAPRVMVMPAVSETRVSVNPAVPLKNQGEPVLVSRAMAVNLLILSVRYVILIEPAAIKEDWLVMTIEPHVVAPAKA